MDTPETEAWSLIRGAVIFRLFDDCAAAGRPQCGQIDPLLLKLSFRAWGIYWHNQKDIPALARLVGKLCIVTGRRRKV